MQRPFSQVDVFSSEPFAGNPVAVVHDGSGLTTEQMQRFALWTNLSETAFLLPPDVPGADYQVRIFTPGAELPFAGHPTLGTCHAWLAAGNEPAGADEVVQQCAAGLVRIRRTQRGLAFAAPPLIRSGPVDEPLVERVAAQLGIARAEIVDAQWADNGPGWLAVLLGSAQAVLDVRTPAQPMDVGVVGPYPPGAECDFEVRAFFSVGDRCLEDPVTGSLNASLAQWLLATGRATAPYVVSQGTVLGRKGRVHLLTGAGAAGAGAAGVGAAAAGAGVAGAGTAGDVWVAGATVSRISGTVDL